MIIVLLIITAVLAIVGWTAPKSWTTRIIAGSFGLVLTLGVVIMLTLNFTHHWGMQKVTTTTTKRIYTAGQTSSPAGILVVKPLGTAKDTYIMVYRHKPTQKQATAHFVPNTKQLVNAAKTTAVYHYASVKHATITTKTTRWQWRSKNFKRLLNVGDQSGELVQKQATVKLPKKTWIALTATQIKRVQKSQKSTPSSTASQAALKQVLTKKVAQYMKEHPTATTTQLKAYQQELTAELAIKSIKATLK
ncbi:hypothetical protein MUDAN_BIHEEGNE_02016 [Lactiplantibacillus mudanjiangensis]|uniref:DUF4811 domain-containing protein n=1 Tax=Lactiplantibacillus mudanjiangensis TaxID=1296538 RepID=UPI00101590C7|nr:hypothetical protein MUDAN_BIHEEGNE_02016 [Lactiplantibacillus mudanjiangensis]